VLVSGVNDFSGTVTLTAGVSPRGPAIKVSPGAVILTPGEAGDARLIIELPSTISAGSYNITIDGTGSGVHHQTILPLNVTRHASGQPPQPQLTILGLQPLQFVGLVSFIVAVGTILVYKKLPNR
jgi:hypothetical protein